MITTKRGHAQCLPSTPFATGPQPELSESGFPSGPQAAGLLPALPPRLGPPTSILASARALGFYFLACLAFHSTPRGLPSSSARPTDRARSSPSPQGHTPGHGPGPAARMPLPRPSLTLGLALPGTPEPNFRATNSKNYLSPARAGRQTAGLAPGGSPRRPGYPRAPLSASAPPPRPFPLTQRRLRSERGVPASASPR